MDVTDAYAHHIRMRTAISRFILGTRGLDTSPKSVMESYQRHQGKLPKATERKQLVECKTSEETARIEAQRPLRESDLLVMSNTQAQILKSQSACKKALQEEPRLSIPSLVEEFLGMVQPVVAALKQAIVLVEEGGLPMNDKEAPRKRNSNCMYSDSEDDDDAPTRKRGSFRDEDDEPGSEQVGETAVTTSSRSSGLSLVGAGTPSNILAALDGVARAANALVAAYKRVLPTADVARWGRARDQKALEEAEQRLLALDLMLRRKRSLLRGLDGAEIQKRFLERLTGIRVDAAWDNRANDRLLSVTPVASPTSLNRAKERREARLAGHAAKVVAPLRAINRMRGAAFAAWP